ncbi:hypothetical protein HPB50_019119 [Hyalomma asiaticum]|uniref:Uncharacterized protein n=1 Tax=Hyalomma asiaticum TaxID=266040 RepID=A0ACB7SRY0_HYAAI|nr:hypothetical protein HPB50_019119 [Hyalomma asiaticum]
MGFLAGPIDSAEKPPRALLRGFSKQGRENAGSEREPETARASSVPYPVPRGGGRTLVATSGPASGHVRSVEQKIAAGGAGHVSVGAGRAHVALPGLCAPGHGSYSPRWLVDLIPMPSERYAVSTRLETRYAVWIMRPVSFPRLVYSPTMKRTAWRVDMVRGIPLREALFGLFLPSWNPRPRTEQRWPR